MNNNNFMNYIHHDTGIGVGTCNPYTSVIIKTQNLQLMQTDLGLTIDIPFSTLCKIETIEINGIKFKKEGN